MNGNDRIGSNSFILAKISDTNYASFLHLFEFKIEFQVH